MEKSKVMQQALKNFMQENFCYISLKKAGIYGKEIKFNDYEAQAKRVCSRLGLSSIYEYGKYEINCHISYSDCKLGIDSIVCRISKVDKYGNLIAAKPFVETLFPNSLHI